jgi:hypothetical protein
VNGLAILAGFLALAVRILLLLSGFLATALLLARLLSGILVLLAGILVLIGHRDLLVECRAGQPGGPELVAGTFPVPAGLLDGDSLSQLRPWNLPLNYLCTSREAGPHGVAAPGSHC